MTGPLSASPSRTHDWPFIGEPVPFVSRLHCVGETEVYIACEGGRVDREIHCWFTPGAYQVCSRSVQETSQTSIETAPSGEQEERS
jgi:hypothetical protein